MGLGATVPTPLRKRRFSKRKVLALAVLAVVVVIVAVTSAIGKKSTPAAPKTLSSSTVGYHIVASRMKLVDRGKTFDVPVDITNASSSAVTPWCAALVDNGGKSTPDGFTNAISPVTPAIAAHSSRVVTLAVLMNLGNTTPPSRAEALCASSKKAADNSSAWATAAIPLVWFHPVAAWYQRYGVDEFPIIETDVNQFDSDFPSSESGLAAKLPALISDCQSLSSDTGSELSLAARGVIAPIPNKSYWAQWNSSVRELHKAAGLCVRTLRQFQKAGQASSTNVHLSLADMLNGARAYVRLTAAVEKTSR